MSFKASDYVGVDPIPKIDVELRTHCPTCSYFGRHDRHKPVHMIATRLYPSIPVPGISVCSECLRDMASILKRLTKK
jgi:hypothetical protein